MWKCSSCGKENGDSDKVCLSCGSRKGEKSGTQTAPPKKKTGASPNDYLSEKALALSSWADKCLVIAIIVGIAVLAFGIYLAFDVGSIMVIVGSALSAAGIGIAGYTLSLFLDGFSTVVESSYRSMMASKKD